MARPRAVRVVIQQPALPRYRVPVFAELARRDGLEVTVLFSDVGRVPSVAAQGFTAAPVRQRTVLRRPREVRFEPAQWRAADPALVDVAVLEFNAGVASLLPAMLRAKHGGVGVVLWGHGYSLRETAAAAALRARFARLADAVLLYGDRGADAMRRAGLPEDRIFIARNCLDQVPIQAARRDWLADPQRLADFKADHGLDRGPVVLFVSRLLEENGVDLLLRAAASLADDHPTLTVAIVGDGPDRQRLERLAGELGITERVRMPGAVYGEGAVAPWFLSADVFCYPKRLGLSILHAFGYGLPVVTDGDLARQNPEVEALDDGENGLLVDPERPGALAGALGELLADDERRSAMAAAALRTALERYTLSNMVDGMESAIRFAYRRPGG